MTTMTTVWLLAPLMVDGPKPEDVKPGWLGFGVFLALAAAVFVLAMSFRKQLKKIDFEEPPAVADSEDRAPVDADGEPAGAEPVDRSPGS